MFESWIDIKPVYIGMLLFLLILPGVINGYPLLYPDSVGYFHAGYSLLRHLKLFGHDLNSFVFDRPPSLSVEARDGISTARSVYYGATYATSYVLFGEWMLALLQAGVTALAITLATTKLTLRYWFIVAAFLTLLTGLSVFSVTIMPDLFTGFLLLAFALVIAYGKVLSRREYIFWLVLALVSCLFHKSNVAILGLTWVTVAPFAWRTKKAELLIFCIIFLTALLGHLVVKLVVKDISGEWPVEPPFGLARMVGDGTAVEYLRDTCSTRHFTTCDYLREMPMTEVQFLWGREPNKSVMGTASRQVRRKIAAEATEIEIGTLVRLPFKQLERSVWNTIRQFATVGVTEFNVIPTDDVAPIAKYRPVLKDYAMSGVAKGRMPLKAISIVMGLTYVVSLVGILWMVLTRGVAEVSAQGTWFVVMLLVGLVQNAFVCGAISGVFDRYQGRVAWLAPLAFVALCCSYCRKNKPSNSPALIH